MNYLTKKTRTTIFMITLIGTGHIFDLSHALQTIFDEKKPEVIGVELDPYRYQALINRKNNIHLYHESRKNMPLIYQLLARFQEDMAQEYGVNAGDEMLVAIAYASNHQIPLEFLDVNAHEIFINMWKTMPFREKIKLLFSGFGSLFVSKKHVEQEIQHIQENLDHYLTEIGKKFPTIKRVLIDERNEHIAQRLTTLLEKYSSIVACIGDGHIPGISTLLKQKNISFETVRLYELQKYGSAPGTSNSAHFSIHYSFDQT
ncbi:MAG: TraB/GumN family protein [Candidatus Thermoplasmatota archaeon]